MNEPKKINCGDYSSCHECHEKNEGPVICPEFKLTIKTADKNFFEPKKEEPDDIYYT